MKKEFKVGDRVVGRYYERENDDDRYYEYFHKFTGTIIEINNHRNSGMLLYTIQEDNSNWKVLVGTHPDEQMELEEIVNSPLYKALGE